MFNAKVMVIQFGRQSHIIFPSLPEEGREEFHSAIEAHFLRILPFMMQWQIYMFVYDIHVYISHTNRATSEIIIVILYYITLEFNENTDSNSYLPTKTDIWLDKI